MHPDTELVAVSTYPGLPDEEQDKRIKGFFDYINRKRDSVPIYNDYHKVFRHHKVDVASIAVPAADNPDVVENIAEKGVHIMCEKPAGTDFARVKRMAQTVRRTKINFTWDVPLPVFGRPFRLAAKIIDEGKIGQPLVAHFMYLARKFMNPKGETGELINFGPYGLLALRKFFRCEVKSVFAGRGSCFYSSYRENETEDFAVASIIFEGGGIGTLVVGRTATATIPEADIRCEVIGNAGMFAINDGLGERIIVYPDVETLQYPFAPGYQLEHCEESIVQLYVNDFVDSVKNHRQPLITLDDTVAVTGMIEMCYQSTKTGQPVDVEDVRQK